jgi:Na+-transporting methylmalonyl-CoA/oxaloacetate decarboxylase beta subunit
MDEKNLLKFWHEQRSQVIHAQLAPSIVLVGILALVSFGAFIDAPMIIKWFAIGIAAATGILAIISQYAAIREGASIIEDLKKVENPTLLARKVSGSRSLLSLTTFATIGIGLVMYALVIWAVLV